MDDWRSTARAADSQRPFDDAATSRRFQQRLRTAAPPRSYPPTPLHYDESGYPIEPRASLATRVRRLIAG